MKQLLVKSWMIKIVMLCAFILGTNFSYGQTEINNLKAITKTNVAGIAFQKKYIKQLRSQLKCNKELLNFIEKETRKIKFKKKYSRELRAQLKRNKESLNSVKKELVEWEQELSSIGDDAQLANIELQNQQQKQQQILQTISNVSKMLHDTAMAIIRKIG